MVRCLPLEPWEINLQQVTLGADCSQLTAREGNWKWECQLLVLQAWLIRVTVLHKINLFFPLFSHLLPPGAAGAWNARQALPQKGEGGKEGNVQPCLTEAVSSLLSSTGTCKACGQTLLPALLAAVRKVGETPLLFPLPSASAGLGNLPGPGAASTWTENVTNQFWKSIHKGGMVKPPKVIGKKPTSFPDCHSIRQSPQWP